MTNTHQRAVRPKRSPNDLYAAAIVSAFLLVIIIGTNPFMEGSGIAIEQSGEGDSLRQGILLSLFLLSVPLFIAPKCRLLEIVSSSPAFVLLMSWSVASLLWSDVADIAARRLLGTLLIASLTVLTVTLPPRRLVSVLLAVTGTVMVVNYAGLYVVPDRALDHEGLWEGLHTHKNVAGYFSAISALLWLFVGRSRRSRWLIAGGIAWAVFSWFTGSRTSFLIFLATIPFGLAFSAGLKRGFDRQLLGVLLLVGALGALPLIIMGLSLVETAFGDLTLTGRTEIWAFVWDAALQAPLLGVGYSSFWAVGDSSVALRQASDFVAQYTEAHNGYLDVLVTLGFVGLFLTLATLAGTCYRALWCYRHKGTDDATREALLCSLLLLTFGILHNGFESTLWQGLSPLWTLMLMSIWVISSATSSNRNYKYVRNLTRQGETCRPNASLQCGR